MTEASEARDGPSPEFLQAYGGAMSEWANVELMLCFWFRRLGGILDWNAATQVFFSARSFTGRADMLLAVIPLAPIEEGYRELVSDIMMKALGYNSVRNQLAHGFVHWMGGEDTVASASKWTEPGTINLQDLRNAEQNFAELRRIIHQSFTVARCLVTSRF